MAAPLSDVDLFHHLAYHVFLPPELPQSELAGAAEQQVRLRLIDSVISTVSKYKSHDPGNAFQCDRIATMLKRFFHSIEVPLQKGRLSQDMINMNTNDVLALYIRAQNAAVLIRKGQSSTIFEVFEVQAPAADVMSTVGKLVRQYPGPAVEVPNSVAGDIEFIKEISSFLAQMDIEEFDEKVARRHKNGSEDQEVRACNTTNPNCFVQLFLGILRGMGHIVERPRITKRIADEVLWKGCFKPWRRSPLWLIIRVAIQTSLDSRVLYKHFMAFYHIEILSQSRQHRAIPSDLLYAMRVKMGRRVFKLQDSIPTSIVEKANTVAEEIQVVLQERWTQIQVDHAQSPEWNPSAFDFEAATHQTLPNSRAYIEQVFRGRSGQQQRANFTPNHKPRLENVNDFARYANGALRKSFLKHRHIALFDFEDSVCEHLPIWTSNQISNAEDACSTLSSCFQQYITAAQSCYTVNPTNQSRRTVDVADQSIMILTLVLLWVAIDELATSQCTLLRKFSPELPENILDALLLRTSKHIEQACKAQQYLRSRHQGASSNNRSIFSGSCSERSFAVQYFRQSTPLRLLETEIEQDARRKRAEKCQELREKNERHAQLDRQASLLTHEYVNQFNEDRWVSNHSASCERCAIEKERDNMKISIHEWPLPNNPQREVILFELQPPIVFTIWRDVTYHVLHDLGDLTPPKPSEAPVRLESYDALRPWHNSSAGTSARVIMASSTETFAGSRYSEKALPTEENLVCVNNGLKFQLYDRYKRHWIPDSYHGAKFSRYGTLPLPANGAYSHLQYALEGTTHTSNEVLADQFHCPTGLSLHEHIAFGVLRSGPRLQWMNILRGLEENILTFSRKEVNLLHAQAAWQIGPLDNNGCREWHSELSNPEFGKLLVSQSEILLERVKENWLEATSVSTAVLLVERLLISSSDPGVAQDVYRFLRKARSVTLSWMAELQVKLKEARDELSMLDYRNLVCEMAAICRSTFDVDPQHIPNLLSASEDLLALTKCSIALYDKRPPTSRRTPESLQVLLCRDHRVSHKMLSFVLQTLRLDRHVFDRAISDLWPHYQASPEGWIALPTPNDRWISTNTAAVHGQASQTVHLDLLDGRLLIDGQPLGRLPQTYVEHPTYVRLFGQATLDVVPASSPGMEFATRGYIHKYQVSFFLDEACDELVIQARQDSRTLELVPFSQMTDDLPEFLSTDYHHWACLEDKTLEFRPLSHPWSSSERQWLLEFPSERPAIIHNPRDGYVLVDIHSPLFNLLALRISPLESSRYLHAALSMRPESQIQLELPRMGLSFFVNQDMQLESNNFCSQVVDENQSTGTMFGLKNQLLLRAKDSVAQLLPRSRCVLIPQGDVRLAKEGYHVSITVQPHSDRRVPFHRFLVDTDLGYLASDTGLTSRLYRIYLHALTSHCLPDPLTGRSGTEEALAILSESATSSFEQINEEQGRLLKMIGSLTPNRSYNPLHLKCMQSTEWSALPSLSQHFGFAATTASIIKRADTLQLFHPLSFDVQSLIVSPEPNLLRRAALRTRVYYPPKTPDLFAAFCGGSDTSDVSHEGREGLDTGWAREGRVAAWAARLANERWDNPIYQTFDLFSLVESWDCERLEGSYEGLSLSYSSQWLKLHLPTCWITLYNLCRKASTESNKIQMACCLASAAFSGALCEELLPVILAFATNRSFANLAPPAHPYFSLADGCRPTLDQVEMAVSSSTRRTPTSIGQHDGPEQNFNAPSMFPGGQRGQYSKGDCSYETQFSQALLSQWPSTRLQSPSAEFDAWFVVTDCLAGVQNYFSSCNRNKDLCKHLQQVEQILSSQPPSENVAFRDSTSPMVRQAVTISAPEDYWSQISIGDLMRRCSSLDSNEPILQLNLAVARRAGLPIDTRHLSALFSEFELSSLPLNRLYGKELNESREDLAKHPRVVWPRQLPNTDLLTYNFQSYHSILEGKFDQLKNSLAPSTSIERLLSACGVWPRITPQTLLQQLSLKARLNDQISPEWRKELISYAQSFTDYQRSQRLITLAQATNVEEFWKELELTGIGCDTENCEPDWLLAQIDGNFSARLVQCQVAKEMISPSSGSNTILQLNMGEGKSSVIVPMVAASLADTNQLVRVVVLKPLWRQMFRLLVNRLSGLVDRRVYYLPFSRHIRVDALKAQQLEELYLECMQEGGILLAQPEHILSYKLMGVDQLISAKPGESEAAKCLRKTQGWLTDYARDILDESDEILHVRNQLIYTIGEQPLEDNPNRWTTTQQVLRIYAQHISHLSGNYPNSFYHHSSSHGQFPTIRIMPQCSSRIEKDLAYKVAKDVLNGHIQNLNCARLSPPVRGSLLEFLTSREFSSVEYESLKRICDPIMWRGLLLVRGLLGFGTLAFALKEKHYRVDYGLDLSRSLLAVPFRAKDIPSPRAEFGHPDVAVVLTCLSYYYKGLTSYQLDHCFELLYKLDNPPLEYEHWVGCDISTPVDLRHLSSINLRDREQFRDKIIPTFSRNSAVIEFFLSSVVFPKAAKGFAHKLSTSGWDLAETRPHVTTGFSGTNDSRYLLPTSIMQADPIGQNSTNALVLTYLLQPENDHYMCMHDQNGQTIKNEDFLQLLVQQEPEIRVLLDVGAQMLELQNEELVRCWLTLTQSPDVVAAIYFNEMDETFILPRNGTPCPFYSSPFAQQLDKCIVYLDEGHTRGTDLKLPQHTRALVTLGPKVTKDRLLQGCMRMRKLGHGQSVMFAAPPEIDNQIRGAFPSTMSFDSPITTLDVLRWTMLETCKDLQHHMPHWAQQGLDYSRRAEAEQRYDETQDLSELEKGWRTPENHMLEQMYGIPSPNSLSNNHGQHAFNIPSLRDHLSLLGIEELGDSSLDEEQEREVSHEVELEQRVERPPKGNPATHNIHEDVRHFIQTGVIRPRSSGFTPLFRPFESFDQGAFSDWSTSLFASVDFSLAMKDSPPDSPSDYMRPINWIVAGPDGVLVALSPYEVNELLPLIRASSIISLHVYAPRFTTSMRSFSNLDFYSIPPRLDAQQPSISPSTRLQLNLFAGQLYLSDYQEYTTLCAILGLFTLPSNHEVHSAVEVESDGFVKPEHRGALTDYHPGYAMCKFTSSPIPMLKHLIALRRKGMKYLRTHMGQMLHARSLTQNNFQIRDGTSTESTTEYLLSSVNIFEA